MKNIVLLSGGLDSATLLYKVRKEEQGDMVALFFDYKQKSLSKERQAATTICTKLGISFVEIDMTDVFSQSKSKIVGDNESGSSEIEFRNGIMLAIAISKAQQMFPKEYVSIYIGVEKIALDYRDCSQEFIGKYNELANYISNGLITIKAPFADIGKDKVLEIAKELSLPINDTWSCYYAEDKPCGKCDACIDRKLLGVFNDTK